MSSWNKTLKFSLVLLLLGTSSCGDLPQDRSDESYRTNGRTISGEYYGTAVVDASPRLNIRKSPAGTRLCQVGDGDLVKVYYTKSNKSDLWAYISSDECQGWASAKYLVEEKRRTSMSHTFPFNGPADADYTTGARAFGSCRDDCNRKHGGADLYGKRRRLVYSVGSGTIVDFSPFYLGTWALVVDHGDFIVRYGELDDQLVSGLKTGSKISRGQAIGYIGKMSGLSQSMLHFERFSGRGRGPLTDRSNRPFQRRSDLVDPTDDLILWKYPRF